MSLELCAIVGSSHHLGRRLTFLLICCSMLIGRVDFTSTKHTTSLWILYFLTLVLHLSFFFLCCAGPHKPMNFITPSGTYGQSGVFYSVVAKINLYIDRNLAEWLHALAHCLCAMLALWVISSKWTRFVPLFPPFVTTNKFDFHQHTHVSILRLQMSSAM